MQDITIGMMIPTSGILPMGKQFDKSFRRALQEGLANTEYEPEIITEIVGQGNPALIEKALDKFFGYHDVKCVSGLVTNKAIENWYMTWSLNDVI